MGPLPFWAIHKQRLLKGGGRGVINLKKWAAVVYGWPLSKSNEVLTWVFCIGKKLFIYISMVARVSKDRLRCKSTTNFGENDETLHWRLCHELEVSSLVFWLPYKSKTKWNLFFWNFFVDIPKQKQWHGLLEYRMRAIISSDLYISNDHFFIFKEVFF